MNSLLAKSCRAQCSTDQTKRTKRQPVLLGFKLSVNASTNCSPYFKLFDQQMCLPVDCSLLQQENLPRLFNSVKMLLKRQHLSHRPFPKEISGAKEKQKTYHNTKSCNPLLKNSDLVLLKNTKLSRMNKNNTKNFFPNT